MWGYRDCGIFGGILAAHGGAAFWGERRSRWGDDNAPQGEYPEGVSPSGRFFGDFLIGEKVTRVQGGAPAGGCRDYRPVKAPGARGGAPALGGCGGKAPQEAPGCPHTRGRKRKTGSTEGAAPLVHPLAWERSRAQRTPCEKAGVLSKFTICLSASSICVI